MIIALTLFIGIFLGGFFIYLLLNRKLKDRVILNNEVIEQNQNAEKQKIYLQNQKKELQEKINELQNQLTQIELINEDLKKKSEEAAFAFYETNLKLFQEKLDTQAEKISKEYQDYEEDCKQHYLKTLEEESFKYCQEI